ncbi:MULTISPECIES: hypothetical protein [Thiorhodovibrio]|nr:MULTISPECIES: hypothetical protein [Thiorhodovibrio]
MQQIEQMTCQGRGAAAQGKRVLLSSVAPLADLADVCPRFRPARSIRPV